MSFFVEDDASSGSGNDENREYRYGPPKKAVGSACAQLFDLPDTFTDLKAHYGQFGFFDTATVLGLIDAIKPHVTTIAVTTRATKDKDKKKALDKGTE